MVYLRIDEISRFTGYEVQDEYGRNIGTVISISSSVDGRVENISIKIADRSLESIDGERLKINDGKVVVVPLWKFEASRLIENLDRAYKRRKALDTISGQNELPSSVIEPMKRRLDEEIKALRIKAEEVKRIINGRISEIEVDEIRVARAIANIDILYFSGEVSEKGYTQSMNHLKRMRDIMTEEKRSAKEYLEKLEKTMQLAFTGDKEVSKPKINNEETKVLQEQQQDSLVVKIEE